MNETLQIIGNHNIFVSLGTLLSLIWAGAYILSWIVQWAWAWVDEGKVKGDNFLAKKICSELPKGWKKSRDLWLYRKYDESGGYIGGTDFYPISGILRTYFGILPLIWFSMLCLNFWYISMWFGMVAALAFTMRMARRGQKLLSAHIADKEAHTK